MLESSKHIQNPTFSIEPLVCSTGDRLPRGDYGSLLTHLTQTQYPPHASHRSLQPPSAPSPAMATISLEPKPVPVLSKGCAPWPLWCHFLLFFSNTPTELCLLVPASPQPACPAPFLCCHEPPTHDWTGAAPFKGGRRRFNHTVAMLNCWSRPYHFSLSCKLSPGVCSGHHPQECNLTDPDAITLL